MNLTFRCIHIVIIVSLIGMLCGCHDKHDLLIQQELLPGKSFWVYKLIRPDHFHEWIQSAVDKDLIEYAVISIPDEVTDPSTDTTVYPIADYLGLDRATYRTDAKKTGWLVRQTSLTSPHDLVISQIKLDRRWQRPGRKYENPGHGIPEVSFIEIPSSIAQRIYDRYHINLTETDEALTFWEIVVKYNIPVIITEGAKKAASLLTAGYAAVSLPGVCGGITISNEQHQVHTPELSHSISPLLKTNRLVTFVFDHDRLFSTREFVQSVLFYTAEAFSNARSNVSIIDLPGPEKGIDDFIMAKGSSALHELIKGAQPFEQWKMQHKDIQPLQVLAERRGCH